MCFITYEQVRVRFFSSVQRSPCRAGLFLLLLSAWIAQLVIPSKQQDNFPTVERAIDTDEHPFLSPPLRDFVA